MQKGIEDWYCPSGRNKKYAIFEKVPFPVCLCLAHFGVYREEALLHFYEMPVPCSSDWQGFSLCLLSQYLGEAIFFLARRIRDKKRKIRLETTLSPKWENVFSGNLMGIALPIPSQFLFLTLFENS